MGRPPVRRVEYLEHEAAKSRLGMVFALTTRAESWFLNRGYLQGGPENLPPSRKRVYDRTRNSKVLIKHLEELDAFPG